VERLVDAAGSHDLLARDALRLAEEQSQARDAVAADVHQRAAGQLPARANVLCVAEREGEVGDRRADPADRAGADERRDASGLGMGAEHEGLHEHAAGAVGGVERCLDLGRVARERLLAQHVLARLEAADRPRDVQRVRQRHVDGVDVVVGEERLVASVRALDAVRARARFGARCVAAGDGDDVDPVRRLGAADDRRVDARGGEESES
jgi:hypothetical protein